jgi:hypothetical protein
MDLALIGRWPTKNQTRLLAGRLSRGIADNMIVMLRRIARAPPRMLMTQLAPRLSQAQEFEAEPGSAAA